MIHVRVASRVVAFTLFVGGCITPALASHPDIIRSFRLIPRHSTLELTGGFAGVYIDYTLLGKFDLLSGYEQVATCQAIGCPPSDHVPFADFENVHVSALNNHPAVDVKRIPLSEFIDLEALDGTFWPDNPHRLFFKGFDRQHQPFELLAVERGPLVHLVGASRAQCCDFFQYKIDALAHIAPYADFNLDGMVDRADMDRIVANLGTLADATFEQGDADGDGDVDGDDLLSWQNQLGTSVSLSDFAADSSADVTFATTTVPEPTSLVAILSAMAVLATRRRARR